LLIVTCCSLGIPLATEKIGGPSTILEFRLWSFVAHFEILVAAEHIPDVENLAADNHSRDHLQLFFSVLPQANQLPIPFAQELLNGMRFFHSSSCGHVRTK